MQKARERGMDEKELVAKRRFVDWVTEANWLWSIIMGQSAEGSNAKTIAKTLHQWPEWIARIQRIRKQTQASIVVTNPSRNLSPRNDHVSQGWKSILTYLTRVPSLLQSWVVWNKDIWKQLEQQGLTKVFVYTLQRYLSFEDQLQAIGPWLDLYNSSERWWKQVGRRSFESDEVAFCLFPQDSDTALTRWSTSQSIVFWPHVWKRLTQESLSSQMGESIVDWFQRASSPLHQQWTEMEWSDWFTVFQKLQRTYRVESESKSTILQRTSYVPKYVLELWKTTSFANRSKPYQCSSDRTLAWNAVSWLLHHLPSLFTSKQRCLQPEDIRRLAFLFHRSLEELVFRLVSFVPEYLNHEHNDFAGLFGRGWIDKETYLKWFSFVLMGPLSKQPTPNQIVRASLLLIRNHIPLSSTRLLQTHEALHHSKHVLSLDEVQTFYVELSRLPICRDTNHQDQVDYGWVMTWSPDDRVTHLPSELKFDHPLVLAQFQECHPSVLPYFVQAVLDRFQIGKRSQTSTFSLESILFNCELVWQDMIQRAQPCWIHEDYLQHLLHLDADERTSSICGSSDILRLIVDYLDPVRGKTISRFRSSLIQSTMEQLQHQVTSTHSLQRSTSRTTSTASHVASDSAVQPRAFHLLASKSKRSK